jgi:D-alanine transaminase
MLVHLNGQLIPRDQARISVFDRGFLFGDGIYEGLRAFGGKVVGLPGHIARMNNGLREARIPWDAAQLAPLTRQLLEANRLADAFIYWHVTRGTPNPSDPVRSRKPASDLPPTVFGFCTPTPPIEQYLPPNPPPQKTAVVMEDTRWLRGHIKAISLIGSVLNTLESSEAGADDAVLVRNGLLAETTSANLIIATPGPNSRTAIATPSLSSVPILAGVTRDLLLAEAARQGVVIEDRRVLASELETASEVIAVGTLTMVTSITRLSGRSLCGDAPGPVATRLLSLLVNAIGREHA